MSTPGSRRFADRVAIVTGAASGLGAAIATRLAAEGARVVLADVDRAGLEQVGGTIVKTGGTATVASTDVTRDADVAAMVRAAESLGGLHVLVLSAAVEIRRPLVETGDADWQRVLDVNLKGPFLCMKHAIPLMVRSRGGSIVALGSTLGAIGQPGYAAYCASKGALVNLCKQAAIEHAPDGVRVNVVSPSACEVGLFARVAEQSGRADQIRAMVASNVPMRRLGTADDVCEAVLFLASDACAYVSAAVLPLDGGLAARRQ
jgi:NAD(P)-dependent dehydrogenase (short-subunit alcohol dehydrogenase family)